MMKNCEGPGEWVDLMTVTTVRTFIHWSRGRCDKVVIILERKADLMTLTTIHTLTGHKAGVTKSSFLRRRLLSLVLRSGKCYSDGKQAEEENTQKVKKNANFNGTVQTVVLLLVLHSGKCNSNTFCIVP